MRFDDRLLTVLAFDLTSEVGARAAWRQLIDLAGRGQAAADDITPARLRTLRGMVPLDTRLAGARALARAGPGRAAVAIFLDDEFVAAAPVVRAAALDPAEWTRLLPRLSPALRSVLRKRRDLAPDVSRALERFGSDDPPPARPGAGATASRPEAGSPIRELIERIGSVGGRDRSGAAIAPVRDRFVFETDAGGVVIGVEGVARGALIGLSLARPEIQGVARIDGVAAGGFRRRSRFENARLEVGGTSDAAGSWRLTGVPAFDPASGRFTGIRGVARRPRADESAAPLSTETTRGAAASGPDALRQLVHELRTPIGAISGFAELIEAEPHGPVPAAARERAAAIRARARDLLAAIDDVDTAARIEVGALGLRPAPLALAPVIGRVVADLAPLAVLRGVRVMIDGDPDASATADDRAAERVVARLFAVAVAAGTPGEVLRASIRADALSVEIAIDRPRGLSGLTLNQLLALDAIEDDPVVGAPLLGTGFALRVARNLAAELGGALELGAARFCLRLPSALSRPVERATKP